MNWIAEASLPQITVAICSIIVVGGTTFYFVMTRLLRLIHQMEQDKERTRKLEKRLDEIETRFTEVQNVVLSIDERLVRTVPAQNAD